MKALEPDCLNLNLTVAMLWSGQTLKLLTVLVLVWVHREPDATVGLDM